MKILRKLLGVLVMSAGILGLLLSLAGLAAIWIYKPAIVTSVDSTLVTLDNTISVSQETMRITGQALGATVDSVGALSVMLEATATSVEDTQPILDQLNTFMGEKLPDTMDAAASSLKTAQQGAEVLDGAIKSLDSFRSVMSAVPLIGSFVEKPTQAYNPEEPLAKSLGDLATQLEGLPEMFVEMSANLDKADDNLVTIQGSLITMSDSVGSITTSLSEYETMVTQSQSSMDDLKLMLSNIQDNLTNIVNSAALVLTLAFLWLLAAQVVILSQGWELYHGTVDRLGPAPAEPVVEPPAGS